MNELVFWSATELARASRSKHVSVQEVIDGHLRRITAINPALNAVVQLTGDQACEQARVADQAIARRRDIGPLHGVPVTVKDTFDTAGIISTAGTSGRVRHVPAKDATVVKRLKDAGAIVLGKTNVSELAMDFESDNLVYGRTNNPYDRTRTSGGNSGGEALSLRRAAHR